MNRSPLALPLLVIACTSPSTSVIIEETAPTATREERPLTCTIELQPKRSPQDPTEVRATLRNTGSTPISLLTELTLFGEHANTEVLHLTRDGDAVPSYGVRLIGAPIVEDSYTTLPPGADVSQLYTVSEHYRLNQQGTYKLLLAKTRVSVGIEEISFVDLDCPTLQFELDGSEENFITPMSDSGLKRSLASFNDCSVSQRNAVRTSEDLAADAVRKCPAFVCTQTPSKWLDLNDKATTIYRRWFGTETRSRQDAVIDAFREVNSRLADGNISNGTDYKCESATNSSCEKGYVAYVVLPSFLTTQIHLCPRFFDESSMFDPDLTYDNISGGRSQRRTLIHEMTHWFAGADDDVSRFTRFDINQRIALNDPDTAVTIAENLAAFCEEAANTADDVHEATAKLARITASNAMTEAILLQGIATSDLAFAV